jgi:hypothetical protein
MGVIWAISLQTLAQSTGLEVLAVDAVGVVGQRQQAGAQLRVGDADDRVRASAGERLESLHERRISRKPSTSSTLTVGSRRRRSSCSESAVNIA